VPSQREHNGRASERRQGFEENAEFFTLTYEARSAVNHNPAYARIAALLWLRAGAQGRRIDKLPPEGWVVADTYGLLTDLDQATAFIHAVSQTTGLRIAYIVTDDDRRFQAIAQQLQVGIEPVRLYESYLTNFSFANGVLGGFLGPVPMLPTRGHPNRSASNSRLASWADCQAWESVIDRSRRLEAY